jgi:hypothetical protein
VLNTGIPPRNPLLGYRHLLYYYGHFTEAASLVRLSGSGLGVEAALALLAALLALATPLLLYHLLRAGAATARTALVATAVTVFVGGLDLVVLGGEALAWRRAWWDGGYSAVWGTNPHVVFPFDNLHWGQHHQAGILLALALAWYLARPQAEGSHPPPYNGDGAEDSPPRRGRRGPSLEREGARNGPETATAGSGQRSCADARNSPLQRQRHGDGPDGSHKWLPYNGDGYALPRRIILAGVVLGGVLVNSVLIGLVALLGAFLLYAMPRWRHAWAADPLWRPTAAAGLAVLLGLGLAGGMLREMRQLPPIEDTRLAFAWPTNALLVTSLVETWRVHQGEVPADSTVQGVTPGGPDFSRLRWKLAATGTALLGLPLQFGVVGILGALGLIRRRGWASLPPSVLALLVAAAFCCLLVANFDLQMRSAATLWLLLSFGVALYLAPGLPRRTPVRVLLGVAGLLGLGSVAFDVAGMTRPVYFDAGDVEVMHWVRDHTPPQAVGQGFPGSSPRMVAMPKPRYFATATYAEFTGRTALFAGHPGMMFPEVRQVEAREVESLASAFTAGTPEESARRFRALGVDYVLWLSGDDLAPWSGVQVNLLDPRYFEPLDRSGESFVVRVR